MKMKMQMHNGAMALVVSGASQDLIIKEEDGGFVVEFVDIAHSAAPPVVVPTVAPVVIPPAPQVTNTPSALPNDIPQATSDDGLFQKLVQLRKQLSVTDKVPPYLVFHDKTLREMADTMPTDMLAMSLVSGVGQAKLERYGTAFLDAINNTAA